MYIFTTDTQYYIVISNVYIFIIEGRADKINNLLFIAL